MDRKFFVLHDSAKVFAQGLHCDVFSENIPLSTLKEVMNLINRNKFITIVDSENKEMLINVDNIIKVKYYKKIT